MLSIQCFILLPGLAYQIFDLHVSLSTSLVPYCITGVIQDNSFTSCLTITSPFYLCTLHLCLQPWFFCLFTHGSNRIQRNCFLYRLVLKVSREKEAIYLLKNIIAVLFSFLSFWMVLFFWRELLPFPPGIPVLFLPSLHIMSQH